MKGKSTDKYIVYFDTSVLRGKESNFVEFSLQAFIDEYCNDPRLTIELRITETAVKEWVKNFRTIAMKHQTQILKDARQLGKMKHAVPVSELKREDFENLAEKYIEDLGLKLVKTPYKKIDFEMLLERAVEHSPPFKATTDEGFKDALIVETMRIDIETSPQKATVVVLIARDGRLEEYVTELVDKKAIEIELYNSIPDFTSELELNLNQLSKELAHKATNYFYRPEIKATPFYSRKIQNKLESAYLSEYVDLALVMARLRETVDVNESMGDIALPGGATLLGPSFDYEVSNAVFVKKDGQRLLWTTTVTTNAEYELGYQSTALVGSPGNVIHKVDYDITWSAKVSSQKFSGMKIIQTDKGQERREYKPTRFQSLSDSLAAAMKAQERVSRTAAGLATTIVPQVPTNRFADILATQRTTYNSISKPASNLAEQLAKIQEQNTGYRAAMQKALEQRLPKLTPKKNKPKNDN